MLVVLLIARGLALIPPGLSIDDYGYLERAPTFDSLKDLVIAQGRPLQGMQFQLMYWLGLRGPGAGALFVVLGIATMMVVALVIVRLWRLERSPIACFFVLVWATVHPYQVEYWTFHTALSSLPTAAMVFLAQYWLRPTRRSITIATLVTTVSLLIYQVPFSWMACVVLVQLGLRLLESGSARWPDVRAHLKSEFAMRVAVLGLAAVLYLPVAAAFRAFYGIAPDPRARLISTGDIPQRLHEIRNLFEKVVVEAEVMVPGFVKAMFFVTLVLAAAGILRRGIQQGRLRGGLLLLAAELLVFVGCLVLVPGPLLVFSSWWPVPRVLTSIGFVWGGVLLGALLVNKGFSRKVLLACASLATLSFVGVGHRVLYEQHLINHRDWLLASRLLARLEALPGFADARALTVVGGYWAIPYSLSTARGDMNITSLYPSWSRSQVLRMVSARRFAPPTAAQEAVALEYKRTHKPWPHPEGVAVIGDLAIICLPED